MWFGPVQKFEHRINVISKNERPKKRDVLVSKFLKTRRNIQKDFRAECIGEQSSFEDYSKLFQAVIKSQQDACQKATEAQQ